MLILNHFRLIMICVLILLFQQPGYAQHDSPLGTISSRTGLLLKDNIVNQLIQHSSGDRAYDYVTQIAMWDRTAASEGYSQAAQWVAEKAVEYGLEGIKIESFPCDGKIEYFGQVMQPQWKVKKAELWLTSPSEMKLTSYEELPMCLAVFSTKSDVIAELTDIGAGKKDEDYSSGVRGKIVLTTSNPAEIFNRAVIKEGALGIISSWSVPSWDLHNRQQFDFPDQVGWSGIPMKGDGAQSHFAFLISTRQATDIRNISQQNIVRVHAFVDAEVTPGNLEVVSGVIPGSKYPNEEIIVSAHLCHPKPGANDNASGSAAILEMARTLNEMIENNLIPQPLRTIRFMWIPEYNGSYAWLSAHLKDPVKIIANLNFDMVGENTLKTNSIPAFNYTSDSNPSFINALLESIVDFANKFNGERYPSRMDMYIGSVKGSRNRLDCKMLEYTTGTDHELYNNLKIGATTLGLWPDNFYHSSEDTPDKVDPTQLHRSIVMGLLAIGTICYADDSMCNSLAELTLLYGRKRIAEAEFSAIQSIYASDKDNFSDADRLAVNLVSHVYKREKVAVSSVELFSHTAESKDIIKRTIALLNTEEQQSLKKAENAAIMRANEQGFTRIKLQSTESEKKALHLYPVRIKGKELYNVSAVFRNDENPGSYSGMWKAMNAWIVNLRNQGKGELIIMGIPDVPAYYADGSRSIADIRNDIAAEYGSTLSLDALENYFQAFEKAGVMKILSK